MRLDEGREPRGLVSELASREGPQRREGLESHAAVLDRPESCHGPVDEERRPDLTALDHGGAMLVGQHTAPVLVAQ